MGKSLVCCQSAAGRWSQDLSADVSLRCTLPTSTLLYTLHSSPPCIHSSSSSDNPEKQLGRHYQDNRIFNPSGNGGPEQWSVLPTVAWEELVVKGLPEQMERGAKQMEGGQLPGRAGVDTRPPCLRPQGERWPPLSHFASASPASPSFLS